MSDTKALGPKPQKAVDNLNPYIVDIEDIVARLANKELERKTNSGRVEFTAIVIKVLSEANVAKQERQLLTDLFLNEEYAVDRENNLTYASNTNKKVAFLHIPALFTYTSLYTNRDAKRADITTSDLFLFPVVTSHDLAPQQQIKISFGDLEDFRDVRIISTPASEKKKLGITEGSIENSIVALMSAKDTCTKLQNTPPAGSKITTKTLVNPSNPLVGYAGIYSDCIKEIITSTNLRRRLITNLGSTGTKNKIFKNGVTIDPLTTNNLESALIAEAGYAVFKIDVFVGDKKIKQFIEANDTATNFKNAQSFPIKLASSNLKAKFDFSSEKKSRLIYFEFTPLDADSQLPTSKLKKPADINKIIIESVEDYIAGVTRTKYNYGFESLTSQGQNVFAIDIFGKTNDADLIDGTVDKAIDYSKVKRKTSQPQPGVLQPVVSFFQQQQAKKPEFAPIDDPTATTGAGKESTATPNKELNACGESNKLINQNVYFSLENAKSVKKTSYLKDNASYKRLRDEAEPFILDYGDDALLATAILRDIPSAEEIKAVLNVLNSNLFNYDAEKEVISIVQEGKEIKSQKQNKKLSAGSAGKANGASALNIGRGTNLEQLNKNGTNLVKFAKSFRNFIAKNEGVPNSSVLLLPLSTFRSFIDVKKPGQGIDQNSRHFFNRAIDFVVYINDNPNFIGFGNVGASLSIPRKDTFEIPNYIVYVYLLKFIKQSGAKFNQCGIGLLERSQKRKTGYIHYEIMSDYKEPEKGTQRTKRNRRWTSQPRDNNAESIYKMAFDKANKDKIIVEFVDKMLKAQTGALPEKFARLLQ